MPEKFAVSDADLEREWQLYAGHREQLTRAVLAASKTSGGRLCVLGAGKCNDLDLDQLADAFSELHLVDLDPASVARAVSRQSLRVREKLRLHTPVDLSLLSAKRSSKWQRKPPTPPELEQCRDAALRSLLSRLPGPFDVVLSACVLTQLGFALTQTFREPHPLLAPLRMSIAQLHLQTLLELTAPGGTSLLVSDLASSTHYPLDQLPEGANLASVMQDVLGKRAFYHLAHPDLLQSVLAELVPEAEPTLLAPWLWSGPHERSYLVYGLSVRRS